jgi:hypothetical protein
LIDNPSPLSQQASNDNRKYPPCAPKVEVEEFSVPVIENRLLRVVDVFNQIDEGINVLDSVPAYENRIVQRFPNIFASFFR